MFSRKNLLSLVLVLSTGFFGVPQRTAATPADDFVTDMTTDYGNIANTVNGPFSKSLGFFSTLGWNSPPGVFDLLLGPRVEVGVGAGADFISIPGLNNLTSLAASAKDNLSLPSQVPIPFPVGTLRVGLFNGLDIGFRLSYLPQINLPDFGFAANYTGWGLDLRYKILDGIQLPTLTVDASWDTMTGNVAFTTKVNQSGSYPDTHDSTVYNADLTTTSTYALNWDVRSFGAKMTIGKDLGMIFPFAGVGFQRNSGTVSSTMTSVGTVNITSPSSSTSAANFSVLSAAAPTVLEPKFVVGFNLGEGFKWSVIGESNGTDIAGSTSFGVQF